VLDNGANSLMIKVRPTTATAMSPIGPISYASS